MTRHERRVPVRMAGRQDRDDEIIRDIEEVDEEFDELDDDTDRQEYDREESNREEDDTPYRSGPTGEVGSEGGSYGELERRRDVTVPQGSEASETARIGPVRHGNRRTR